MFNIGIGELILIAVFVLIFIGPERLPDIMRQIGEAVYQLRVIVNEFNSQFAEELRPLQEIQGLADDLNPMRQIGDLIDPTAKPGSSRAASPTPVNTIAPPAAASTPATNPMKQLTLARQTSASPPAADPMKRLASVAKPAQTETSPPDSETSTT